MRDNTESGQDRERGLGPAELIAWASRLIAIPSYPEIYGGETKVAEYICQLLRQEGIESWIDPLPSGGANVYGRLPGSGQGPSLMLNGHLDTVPPYDMENACQPRLQEGRLVGRGASDMKGPLAAMLGALIGLRRGGRQLAGYLIFAGVANEEESSLGCLDLQDKGYRADAAVVGEPLGTANLCIAQKGLEWYQVDFQGRTVHGGSQQQGVNAILKAVDFINALQAQVQPALEKRRHDLLGCSTMNIGVIDGGTQLSTVAGHCRLQLDRRFLPGQETYESMGRELQDLLDRLSGQDPDFQARLSVAPASIMRPGFVHQGFELSADSNLVRSCQRAYAQASGKQLRLCGCPCWTDAGLLSYYGHIPTLVWGGGFIEQCHSREEYNTVAEIELACRMYMALARDFCGLAS